MKPVRLLFALLFLGFSTSGFSQLGDDNGQQQKMKSDARVANALDRLGYKYERSESGNYKVTLKEEDGRTQLVSILAGTETYETMEIREVRAVAFSSQNKNALSPAVLFALLEENERKKLGSWQIAGGEPPYLLYFSVRVSANAGDKVLQDIIELVSSVADKKEKELTGKDDF